MYSDCQACPAGVNKTNIEQEKDSKQKNNTKLINQQGPGDEGGYIIKPPNINRKTTNEQPKNNQKTNNQTPD